MGLYRKKSGPLCIPLNVHKVQLKTKSANRLIREERITGRNSKHNASQSHQDALRTHTEVQNATTLCVFRGRLVPNGTHVVEIAHVENKRSCGHPASGHNFQASSCSF